MREGAHATQAVCVRAHAESEAATHLPSVLSERSCRCCRREACSISPSQRRASGVSAGRSVCSCCVEKSAECGGPSAAGAAPAAASAAASRCSLRTSSSRAETDGPRGALAGRSATMATRRPAVSSTLAADREVAAVEDAALLVAVAAACAEVRDATLPAAAGCVGGGARKIVPPSVGGRASVGVNGNGAARSELGVLCTARGARSWLVRGSGGRPCERAKPAAPSAGGPVLNDSRDAAAVTGGCDGASTSDSSAMMLGGKCEPAGAIEPLACRC